MNLYNVSAVVELVIWVVCEAQIADPLVIGIATPYAAQVNYIRKILDQVEKDKPGYDWKALRIGTTEWFQGREAPYMVNDFVRASNDLGELDFMAEGRRLNVLLSHQQQALVIFGNKGCTKPVVVGDAKEDEFVAKRRNEINRHLLKVFALIEKKGRLVNIPTDSLSQDYVALDPLTISTSDDAPVADETSGSPDWNADSPFDESQLPSNNDWDKTVAGETREKVWAADVPGIG